jgi:hypothetical protein
MGSGEILLAPLGDGPAADYGVLRQGTVGSGVLHESPWDRDDDAVVNHGRATTPADQVDYLADDELDFTSQTSTPADDELDFTSQTSTPADDELDHRVQTYEPADDELEIGHETYRPADDEMPQYEQHRYEPEPEPEEVQRQVDEN